MSLNSFTRDLFIQATLCRRGKYIRAGNIRTYYETYGEGEPLFFLHGGLSNLDTFRYQVPLFARHYQVILPERSGHGHTRDISGAYAYEKMAQQTADFADALNIKKAKWVGYSDGANLLYWLALKRPDLVERFVSVGGNFHHRGCEATFQKELKKIDLKKVQADRMYEKYSPDPKKHYAKVFAKVRKLWLTQPQWTVAQIRKIRARALIVVGDNDMIKHEHSLQLYRNLQNAQLAIIPGTTHGLLKEKPELVNKIILDFLVDPNVGFQVAKQ